MFAFPWEYTFPPFFTIQPNLKTQEEQIKKWKKIILDFHKHHKKCTLNVGDDSELFSNEQIGRKLPVDGRTLVMSELEKSGNAGSVDKRRLQWEVYWYPLEELGNLIYKYVSDNGLNNTVCTVFELVSGEDTTQEEFHGMDEAVVLKALKLLQGNGKCEVFEDGEGVKLIDFLVFSDMDEHIIRLLLEPVKLEIHTYLHFGSIIQLCPLPESPEFNCLSVTPSKYVAAHPQEIINERSALTLAGSTFACRRNTFQLVHPENEDCEEVLKYNEDFLLQSCCPRSFGSSCPENNLVLYSSNRIMENPLMDMDNFYRFYYTKGNLHQPVALTTNPPIGQKSVRFDELPLVASIYSRWKCVHTDPEYRYENEDQPIPVSDPVLILHSATNKYLTPEWDKQRLTSFGPESSVSVSYRPPRSLLNTGMWRFMQPYDRFK